MKKFILFIILLGPSCVWANSPEPPIYTRGKLLGTSPMKDITVLHEYLTLDFTKEEEYLGDVKVTATYKISCPHVIDTLYLFFVANNLVKEEYSITLDGKPVQGTPEAMRDIPSSWKAPDTIQGAGEQINYYYSRDGLFSYMLHNLTIGSHLLTVTYMANTISHYSNEKKIAYKSLVYILKPGENPWKEFDTLDLTVIKPQGLDFNSNLPLVNQSPTTLNGKWGKLPTAYVSFALSKSMVTASIVTPTIIYGCIAIYLFLICLLFYRLAKTRVIKQASRIGQFLSSIAIVLLSCTIVPFIIICVNNAVIHTIVSGINCPYFFGGRNYAYAIVFGVPILFILSLILTIIINLVINAIVNARFKPKDDPNNSL